MAKDELVLDQGKLKPPAKKKAGRPKGSKNKTKTYKSVASLKKELATDTVIIEDDKKVFINVDGEKEVLVGQDEVTGRFTAGNNYSKARKTFTNNEILQRMIDVEGVATVINDMIISGTPEEKKVGLNFIKSIMFKDAAKTVDQNITTKSEQVIDKELQDMLDNITGDLSEE